MFQRLYDRTMSLASHRHALRVLALVSFAESSIFPIPPDAMLIPMVLAHRERAWTMAAVCTIASVLGGILGYVIGYFLFEAVGRPILDFYGYQEEFQRFADAYNRWGLWIILIKGLTPIPYKLVTIASGVAQFDPVVFILASIATRGARFFLVAALLRRYGPPIRTFVEKNLTAVATAALVLIVGGFVAVKYLF
ncbi:MAG TPA: YqaA family protein [Alphaproteobacteria bacterium]|jgi:membrane protein YqaA with SNARE-associated domain|nr:YqaA family protein [Alphaproteobacteria bacterium]